MIRNGYYHMNRIALVNPVINVKVKLKVILILWRAHHTGTEATPEKQDFFVLFVLFQAAVYYLSEFSKGGKYFSVSVWNDQDFCSKEARKGQGKVLWDQQVSSWRYLPFLNDIFTPYLFFLRSASPKNLKDRWGPVWWRHIKMSS